MAGDESQPDPALGEHHHVGGKNCDEEPRAQNLDRELREVRLLCFEKEVPYTGALRTVEKEKLQLLSHGESRALFKWEDGPSPIGSQGQRSYGLGVYWRNSVHSVPSTC